MTDPETPDREPDEEATWDKDGRRYTRRIWREPDGSTFEEKTDEPIPVEEMTDWLDEHLGPIHPTERTRG